MVNFNYCPLNCPNLEKAISDTNNTNMYPYCWTHINCEKIKED